MVKNEILKAKGINKIRGLMFRLHPNPLQFNFDTPVSFPIHSMFCRSFIAEWYDEDNVLIERRFIKPFKNNIRVHKKYKKLIEYPFY